MATTRKVLILHFNSIKKYPPATNVEEVLKSYGMDVCVVTTSNGQAFFTSGIFQKICLAWAFLKFHLSALKALTLNSFDLVIAYEHLSILPLKWHPKASGLQKVWLHFHEYVSPQEISDAGPFSSICWKHVPAVVEWSDFTTHTNPWRLTQFRTDMGLGNLDAERFGCIPNTPTRNWLACPPTSWNKIDPGKTPLRLVYHGALHRETTHIERLCELLDAGQGEVTLDIFTNDSTEGIGSNFLTVHPFIPYHDLPDALCTFDIGLVIYRGLIPNYQFNQPNKLWEYLGCKMPVVVSSNIDDSMITSDIASGVSMFDFERGDYNDFRLALKRLGSRRMDHVVVEPFETHLQKVLQRLLY